MKIRGLLFLPVALACATPTIAQVTIGKRHDNFDSPARVPLDCSKADKTTDEVAACAAKEAVRETRFTGYWTFLAALLSGLTLVAVAQGFRQSVETQKQEFSARIRTEIGEFSISYSLPNTFLSINAFRYNYGRTVAGRLIVVVDWLFATKEGFFGPTYRTSCDEDDIHPTITEVAHFGSVAVLKLNVAELIKIAATYPKIRIVIRTHYDTMFGNRVTEVVSKTFDIKIPEHIKPIPA